MIRFHLYCFMGLFHLPSSWGLGEPGVALGTLLKSIVRSRAMVQSLHLLFPPLHLERTCSSCPCPSSFCL